MKTTGLFFTLFALIGSTMAASFQNCATINANYTIFNLCPFAQSAPYNMSDSATNTTVTFSLGNNRVKNCNASTDIWAIYKNTLKDTCDDIAVGNPTYSLINTQDPKEGLVITFPIQNETDQVIGSDYQLVINLVCGPQDTNTSRTVFTRNEDVVNDDLTIISLTAYSKYGCPVVSLNQYIDFLVNSEKYLAIIFGVTGLILCFFGLTMFKFAIFFISATAGTIITGSIFFEFTNLGTDEWVLWCTFAASLVLGFALGVIALKLEKLAHAIVGAALGVVGGLILYNAVIAPIVTDKAGTFPFYFVLIVLALVGAGVALYMFEKILIVATSLIGAYLTIRSLSIFIGGFPLETYVAEGLQQFDAAVYAYLFTTIVLSIWGMYFQFKNRSRRLKLDSDELEKEPLAKDGYLQYDF